MSGKIGTVTTTGATVVVAGTGVPYEILNFTSVSGNLTVTNNGTKDVTIFKTSDNNSWNGHALLSTGFTAPVTMEFFKQAAATDNGVSYAMIGWNSDPTTNASYDSLDWAAYPYRTDNYSVYHNGADLGFFGVWNPANKFYIVYTTDGYIRHYNGSTLLYSVFKGTGQTVYLDNSFYAVNSTFGGFSNIRVRRDSWTGAGGYTLGNAEGPSATINYAPPTATINFNGFGAKLGPAATVLITSANAPEISTATTITRFNSIFINSSLSITGNETTQPIQIYTRDATVNYEKTQWIIPEPMNQIRGQPITTSTVVIGAVVTSTYVRSTATGSINAFRITPTTLIKNNYIPVTIDGGSHTDSYKTAVAINRMSYQESIGIDRLDTLVIVNTINTATTKVRIFANQRTSINQSKSVTDSLTGSTDFYVIGTGTGTISSGTTITRYWV